MKKNKQEQLAWAFPINFKAWYWAWK